MCINRQRQFSSVGSGEQCEEFATRLVYGGEGGATRPFMTGGVVAVSVVSMAC